MLPFGRQTVTLLHRSMDGYQVYTLYGCSWQDSSVRTLGDNALTSSLETTCRIPADQQKPAPGDLLALGEHAFKAKSDVEVSRLRDTLRAEGTPAFRALTVADNSRGGVLPHYAASGG